MRTLTFEVHKYRGLLYVLWPWTLMEFLYEAVAYGVRYELVRPSSVSRSKWIEVRPVAGEYFGEYKRNLFYGIPMPDQGDRLYRQFTSTHYMTQHGLDGIPRDLWQSAYELGPGEPQGDVCFEFKIHSEVGLFMYTNYEWLRYFVSGRNSRKLSDMGITVKEKSRDAD